ncbi:candidapepsin-9 [[Candida] anglica]|uniref:candidapepsin n=1 Tax=[Candida] anglica TaxID=148631 RepID=A0ABP0EIT6_9ASCO
MRVNVAAVALCATLSAAKNVLPLRLDFSVHRGTLEADSVGNDPEFIKRDDKNNSVSLVLANEKTFYKTELEFGSNGDKVSVVIDTGSSDLWIPSNDVQCLDTSRFKRDVKKTSGSSRGSFKPLIKDASQSQGGLTPSNTCTSYGSFATENSDTFHVNSSVNPFAIHYADNSKATGVWGYDNVKIGNHVVKDLSFAVANVSSSNIGVLGIGYASLEATTMYSDQSSYYSSSYTSYGGGYMYENLPMKLKSNGLIKKNVFSMYLNSPELQTGTVLFGAVDHAKYEGKLQTVQIVGSDDAFYEDPNRIIVVSSGISIDDNGNEITVSSDPHPALLDSGSTISFFPQRLLDQLGEALGGTYSTSAGAYKVPCVNDSNVSVQISFGGAVISVPYANLLLPIASSCYLGVLAQSEDSDYILFGDNILTSAYLVFDLDDDTLSLAQAKYTDDEDIEVISDSIPRAVLAAGYSSTSYMEYYPSSDPTATANVRAGSSTSGAATNGSRGHKSSLASTDMKLPTTTLALLMGAISIVALL